MRDLRALAIACCCVMPIAASAMQWQWIDNDGRRVFSDKAPPPEVPVKNILKSPTGVRAADADAARPAPAAPAAADAAKAASAPRVAGRDKDLEAKKKKADAAADEEAKAKEREVAEARAENCKKAQKERQVLDSGVRIQRINDKGEREILDDAGRAEQAKKADSIIARDCGSS